MDSAKNRGRRKFFRCFTPIGSDDNFGCDSSSPPSSDDESGRRTKKKLHRSFSGSVKAALSKTSLVKKFRSKNQRQDSFRSSSCSDSSSRSEKFANFIKMKKHSSNKGFSDSEESNRPSPTRSSLFSPSSSVSPSSSRSSSISCNSRSNSLGHLRQINIPNRQQNLTKREMIKCVYSRIGTAREGMLSFMVCLLSLVLCGKVFAIMACTATWLYFAPAQKCSRLDSVVDSEEYKKKSDRGRVVGQESFSATLALDH